MFRRLSLVAAAAIVLTGAVPFGRDPFPQKTSGAEWLSFDGTRHPRSVITAQNVSHLKQLWRVVLPETADGSPVYLGGVQTRTGRRDLLIVSTINGRVIAFDAANGFRAWMTTPPEGTRWTTSSPAVDPGHRFVFAYGLDGYVHRYNVHTGDELTGGGWPELATLKGAVEKGSSAISIATANNGHTYLYMTASAYPIPGDDGDYQGHVTVIDIDSGVQHVFNALCSDRDMHFTDHGDDSDCPSRQAGIWARSGVAYDPGTNRVFVTTGNGPFDANTGGFDWGTSVVAIRPDGTTDGGTPVDAYTPVDFQSLTDEDLDLSSTTIEVLPGTNAGWPSLGVQSGKDGRLRLLNLSDLSGQGGPRHLGGELQILDLPQGHTVLTQPTPWLDPAHKTWVFVANNHGITAYQLIADASGKPMLTQVWSRLDVAGTTPVIVNGVIYLAAPQQLTALRATTGATLWQDTTIGDIHWSSPIVVNDTVYLSDNSQTLTAYSLPTSP
ncbi:MAG TPA: PQQ-binding-like beta-propeller repeat protein [Thermoanaerobaculia bacterium]|nr:PQQ-binding-like beta-propeller repeat protein [Thermoanaerobaculia bacterium]